LGQFWCKLTTATKYNRCAMDKFWERNGQRIVLSACQTTIIYYIKCSYLKVSLKFLKLLFFNSTIAEPPEDWLNKYKCEKCFTIFQNCWLIKMKCWPLLIENSIATLLLQRVPYITTIYYVININNEPETWVCVCVCAHNLNGVVWKITDIIVLIIWLLDIHFK
jgi:hypothetical protein